MNDQQSHIETSQKIQTILKFLAVSVRNMSLYPMSHPVVKHSIGSLYKSLNQLLENKQELTFGIVGNELVVENIQFYDSDIFVHGLVDNLKKHKVEKITFLKGLKNEGLVVFLDLLSADPAKIAQQGGIAGKLLEKNVSNIKIGRLHLIETKEKGVKDLGYDFDITSGDKIYREGIEVMESVCEDIIKGRRINISDVRDMVNNMVSSVVKNSAPLLLLTTIKTHDDYTFTHSMDVSILTLAQVETLGFSEQMLNDIGTAALLHDTGKLLIPSEIIRKPGKLTPEEWEIIQKHPEYGAKKLAKTSGICELAPIIAFEHHQKYNLTGYPKQLKRLNLNLISLMTTISDVFDALKSKRAYSAEVPSEKAISIMIELAGKDFEPALLKRFIQIVGIYPLGTIVSLNTNEVGIVIKTNPQDSLRPQLKIILDENGVEKQTPETVDLTQRDSITKRFQRSIVASIVDPETKNIDPRKYLHI